MSLFLDLFEICTILINYLKRNNFKESRKRKDSKVHQLILIDSKHGKMVDLTSNMRNENDSYETWLLPIRLAKLKGFLGLPN